MKKISILIAFVTLFTTSSLVNAEYVWWNQLSVVADKAYSVLVNSEDGTSDLVQYSFPALVELNRLNLGSNFYIIQAYETGLVFTESDYSSSDDSSEETEAEFSSKFKSKFKSKSQEFTPADSTVYTETVTNTSYDLDLNEVSSVVFEYKYSYYWAEPEQIDDESVASGSVQNEADSKCGSKKKKNKDCVKVTL